ncbi:uncharacterized protein LOC118168023 isoform X4 [Oxyura jamaicensis]|uniref:uncharacterized protein LOC118168023 isoform X4 n=1 Tax=Oxyura jamaicensis TaxID=8884 RepID=UPI0015A5F775|nr:uncharacterized protein LOC118168023 isoform X4 [Oxyura jamaicensis]
MALARSQPQRCCRRPPPAHWSRPPGRAASLAPAAAAGTAGKRESGPTTTRRRRRRSRRRRRKRRGRRRESGGGERHRHRPPRPAAGRGEADERRPAPPERGPAAELSPRIRLSSSDELPASPDEYLFFGPASNIITLQNEQNGYDTSGWSRCPAVLHVYEQLSECFPQLQRENQDTEQLAGTF